MTQLIEYLVALAMFGAAGVALVMVVHWIAVHALYRREWTRWRATWRRDREFRRRWKDD